MATKTKAAVNRLALNGENGDAKAAAATEKEKRLTISAPNIKLVEFKIVGTAPYVQNRFGAKAIEQMKGKQEAGSQANKGKKKEPKDFQRCYEDAKHVSKEGWCGIPAPAFRIALVDACRLVNFKMTLAKCSIFCEADGFDRVDGTPLVKINKGEPHYVEHAVRNDSGVADIRPRPMWDEWEAVVRLRFDADMFTLADIANLLHRVGVQIGIGEGRAFSKNSCGQGWGSFRLAEE